MPPRTGRAGSWAALAALPSAAGAVCVLLLCGAFSSAHPAPWALLAAAVLGAVARWGLSKQRRPWYALEERSEEHTSELQSLAYLVCRLLLEKKKNEKTSAEYHVKNLGHTDCLRS